MRAQRFFQVNYGFDDASGNGFEDSWHTIYGISYHHGIWCPEVANQSSYYREFQNVNDSIKREGEEGILSDAFIIFATDNTTGADRRTPLVAINTHKLEVRSFSRNECNPFVCQFAIVVHERSKWHANHDLVKCPQFFSESCRSLFFDCEVNFFGRFADHGIKLNGSATVVDALVLILCWLHCKFFTRTRFVLRGDIHFIVEDIIK